MFRRYKCPDDAGWLGWFEDVKGNAIAWVGLDRVVVFAEPQNINDLTDGAFPEGDEECGGCDGCDGDGCYCDDCDCEEQDCEDIDEDIDDEDIRSSLPEPPSHLQCGRDGGDGFQPPKHPDHIWDGGKELKKLKSHIDECCPHADQDCEKCEGMECLDRYRGLNQ